MPTQTHGLRSEEAHAQRHDAYVRENLDASCRPPTGRTTGELYGWRLAQVSVATGLPARHAVRTFACVLATCMETVEGGSECRLTPADGYDLRLSAARAALAPRTSNMAAPSLFAAPLLLDAVVLARELSAFERPRRRASGRLLLGIALSRVGNLDGAIAAYRGALQDALEARSKDAGLEWKTAEAAARAQLGAARDRGGTRGLHCSF